MSYHEGSKWQEQNEDRNKFAPRPQPTEERAVNKAGSRNNNWRRYRFQTKSVEDYRPLIYNPKYPWWCSGERADGAAVTIIAWLPVDEVLTKYWDDAYEIEATDHLKIEFNGRFPRPSWFID